MSTAKKERVNLCSQDLGHVLHVISSHCGTATTELHRSVIGDVVQENVSYVELQISWAIHHFNEPLMPFLRLNSNLFDTHHLATWLGMCLSLVELKLKEFLLSWVPLGNFGFFRVHFGSFGFICFLLGLLVFLWVLLDSSRFLWVPLGTFGFLRVSMGSSGFLCVALSFIELH